MGSWTDKLDKQKRYETSGGGQRCRSQKKEGGMHGARLRITEKETGMTECSKELGVGRRYWMLGQCSSGKPTDTEEANDTDKHTRKGVFLYSEPSATTMAQGPHREHRR